MLRRIFLLLAVGAIFMLAFAAPALAKNTGDQKLPGATGPPIASGGQHTTAFHCKSPDVIGTRGAFVINKNHVHNNCDEEL
jgi:hypothetical protein